jgi:hypothetical protein
MILSGRVLDKITLAPLFGAAVFFKGTSYGSQTDVDGKFSFEAPAGTYELNIKNIGYTTLDSSINFDKNLIIEAVLNPEATTLQTVTVTAQAPKPKTKIDFTKFIVPGAIALGLLLLLFTLERKR